MPLDVEDATPPDNPARALTRKEISGAQQKEAEMMQPPKPVASPSPPGQVGRQAESATGGGTEAQPQGQPNAQTQPEQQPAPSASQSQGKVLANKGMGMTLTPEQTQYYDKVAQNPWLPVVDEAALGAEALWNIAHHVVAGWNGLTEPNAQSISQHAIWSRNDALAKLVQFAEAGPAGQFNHGQSEWYWENFGNMITSGPAYANPLSGTALFAASLAGAGPENLKDVPGAI